MDNPINNALATPFAFLIYRLDALLDPSGDCHGPMSLSDSPDRQTYYRSTFSIVQSCLLTIVTCTWASLHPNIPSYQGLVFAIWFRLNFLLVALIVPDFVVLWAAKQYLASRHLAERHKEFGWTHTHAFFALMGGYLFIPPGLTTEKGRFLSPYSDRFKSLLSSGKLDIPVEDIEDKSKSDIFLKTLNLLQSSWFILHLAARGHQRLAITHLELVTVVYAVLSFATYFFWWNKPQNVDRPFRVYADEDDRSSDGHSALKDSTSDQPLLPPLPTSRDTSSEEGSCASPPTRAQRRKTVLKKTRTTLARYFATSCITIATYIIWPRRPHISKHGADFMPKYTSSTYYGELSKRDRAKTLAAASVVAAVVGGLYLCAWGFMFPTRQERLLWRISAGVTLAMPVYMLLDTLYHCLPERFERSMIRNGLGWLSDLGALLMGISVYARMILLVQVCVMLRTQPPEVYKTVSWAQYLPHAF